MSPLTMLVVSCLVIASQAMTTHHPHRTHEPNENESFSFYYNYHTQNLLIKARSATDAKCYVVVLSEDEKKQVHHSSGLRTIEVRALGMLTTAVGITSDSLDDYDVKYCGHGPHNSTVSYFTV